MEAEYIGSSDGMGIGNASEIVIKDILENWPPGIAWLRGHEMNDQLDIVDGLAICNYWHGTGSQKRSSINNQ